MKTISLCLVVLTTIFVTGCPKYRPSVDFQNTDSFRGRLNEHLKNEQLKYYCYRDGKDYDNSTNAPHCTGASGSLANGPARAKQVRNELLDDALSYIDDAYGDFKNDLTVGRDRGNFIADVVDLGMSAAVGITNGERPLQILGVALTAFRGGRRSADLNFYKDQSTPILISKMEGNRARVRASILDSENKDIESYRIGMAISDIVAYYNAGTLVEAFTMLARDTNADTKKSQDDLADLKKKQGIRGAPTKRELEVSKEFSKAILDLKKAYDQAKAGVTAANGKITTAGQTIDTANNAITQANQDIGTATAQITAAANPTAKAQAEAAKSKAEADKAKAEASKTKAESDKAAAESAKADAVKARDQALSNLRATFDAIAADPKLSPVLNKSPEADDTLSDAFRASLRAMLDHLKQKPTPSTDAERDALVDEYAKVLLQFSGLITDAVNTEPELSDRLSEILKTNK